MKFMQIKPQKARGVLKDSMWTDPEWVAEEKFDGDRRIAQFEHTFKGPQDVRFTGTRESVDGSGFVEKSENIPHLSDEAPRSLDGTVLDGEIVAPFAKDLPGGKSKYVTAIMGSKPERAIELQRKYGWLEYMVFDCLWYKGKDVRKEPLLTRRQAAQNSVEQWGNKYAHLVTQISGSEKKLYLEQLLDNGEEGVVLKHEDQAYGDEKLWVKVKGEWTADVVIISFKPGEGKYAGQAGAICFGQYRDGKLAARGFCSGFDDATRKDMTLHKRMYTGRVIEIAHNGREPTGAFRHPRFKRFRPDKNAQDCVYREDET